jgi:hypothetical protein
LVGRQGFGGFEKIFRKAFKYFLGPCGPSEHFQPQKIKVEQGNEGYDTFSSYPHN